MSAFSDATLFMAPGNYKSGKVYSDKPINGNGDFSFSRASTAYTWGSGLNIESVSSSLPRLSYLGQSCPYWLFERASTNLVSNSEAFASYYTLSCSKSNLGAFDYRSSAELALFTATGAAARFGARNSATVNGQKYTHSFIVDLNQGGRYVGILSGSTGAVDCQNETVLVAGGIGLTAKFRTIAAGIKVVQLTFTADTAGNCFNIITTSSGSTATTNETVAATCFKIETGEPTSYIATTGSTATRVVDAFTLSGLQTNSILGATAGTWTEWFNQVQAGDVISFSNGTQTTKLILESGNWKIEDNAGTKTTIGAYAEGDKIAIRWSSSAIAAVLNGGAEVATTVAYSQAYSSYSLGTVGTVEKMLIAAYSTQLTEANCQSLTS